MFLTMLSHHIRFQGSYSWQFHFLIPGSEIPKWFSHRSEGTSLNLQGPSDFMGMTVCAIFVLRQHCSPQHHRVYFYCDVIGTKISENLGIGFSEEFGKIDSYHLWIKYFPFKGKWEKELSEIDANGLSQIVVKFETFGPGLEVTKCGARLVYKQDIEDLKQTMAWSSKCRITPYEDDSNGNGAGPSGEGTFDEVDEPHPKWIQHPNLIENWIENLCTQGQGNTNCVEEESQ